MNTILMAYAQDAFQEFILPTMNNSNYQIVLNKRIFGLDKNCEISMEVGDSEWCFLSGNDYLIKKDVTNYENVVVQDGDLLDVFIENQKIISILVIQTNRIFQVFKKYNISNIDNIVIGKRETNDIVYSMNQYVSRTHARIYETPNGMVLEDNSANGVFINSYRVNKERLLEFGDSIRIFGLHIIYMGKILAICCTCGELEIRKNRLEEYHLDNNTAIIKKINAIPQAKQFFNRSPREQVKLFEDTVEIEPPPSSKVIKEKPLILSIGPAFTMAIPMVLGCMLSIMAMRSSGRSSSVTVYTGIVTAGCSALIGAIWTLANLHYSKSEAKKEEALRFDTYGNYLVNIVDYIREKYEYNTHVLREAYPDTSTCCKYNRKTPKLWNRNFTHKDMLYVRIGIGMIPFQGTIDIPKIKFTMNPDKLAEKPGIILENYNTLRDVSVGINLFEHRLIGICGEQDRASCVKVMHVMVAQLAASTCYTDVKFVFIYNEKTREEQRQWEFVKWFPHVWSQDKKTRYVATNKEEASDLFYELVNIFRVRDEENRSTTEVKIVKPHYILFLSDPSLIFDEPIAKYLLNPLERYGVTTILMAERKENLPNACEDIICVDGDEASIYNTLQYTGKELKIKLDQVRLEDLLNFSRELSGIEVNEVESSSSIANSLDFFEMYGVSTLDEFAVLKRWKKNRTYESMKALIGKKQGGVDTYLDIHEKYHGPHGLIAGTTGSGKSETLQTYMLSLAINYSPNDIGFFVIDFKGGGMANLFSNLPHMIGQISNLSGNQVRRAMVSIKSENKRRQRVFNDHGVNNINLYTRLVKNNEASLPIPHLFIIIDEFAELKREEPEFMKELISVAQVGRSLGVHLILATQKPSGTVDDNIWSNTKFRLCLRVQDKQDSNDMLHKPDAAYLTQAGRCYLQVGQDEVYELFQSGWSGATYDEETEHTKTEIATMLTMTGKTAIVGNKTRLHKKELHTIKWITYLVNCIQKELEQLNETIESCKNSQELLVILCQGVIKRLEMDKKDYPDSVYNRTRLEDFIKMWNSEITDSQEITQDIIRSAKEKHKKLPELKEKTQLDAVVDYLKELAVQNGYTNNFQLWLPVLPEKLYLNDLDGYNETSYKNNEWINHNIWSLDTIIGLYDDPENQIQKPLVIDFAKDGHHVICGSVVTGKSTFLQSITYSLISKYSPEHINIYALDFSSKLLNAFKDAPHVGDILFENDFEHIEKLFHMFQKILTERKELLGGGNYNQYVKANGLKIPAIIFIIDNYASFKEKTDNKYESILMQISREGVSYGIYLLISAGGFGGAEIQNRIADNIKTVVCLNLGEKFKYVSMLRTTRIDILPEADVKGRGVAYVNGEILEFQTALAFDTDDDYQRMEKISAFCSNMRQHWKGSVAKKVPVIPEQPEFVEFSSVREYQSAINSKNYLPLGYSMADASVWNIDLLDTYCYMILGKSKTGKTNTMKALIYTTAKKQGASLCIIDDNKKQLKAISQEVSATYIQTDKEMFEYWKELVPIFKERNKKKHEYEEQGFEELELFNGMSEYKPIFIFISNMESFIHSLYSPAEGVGAMSGFIENIFEKGCIHNIYFFACINPDDISNISSKRAYMTYAGYKKGVHLGGNMASQRIFAFSNIPYSQQSKSMKPGIGITPSLQDESCGDKVALPLVKKNR